MDCNAEVDTYQVHTRKCGKYSVTISVPNGYFFEKVKKVDLTKSDTCSNGVCTFSFEMEPDVPPEEEL